MIIITWYNSYQIDLSLMVQNWEKYDNIMPLLKKTCNTWIINEKYRNETKNIA